MTLKEISEIIKEGDCTTDGEVSCVVDEAGVLCYADSGKNYIPYMCDLVGEWEIVKPEPKVLNAHEMRQAFLFKINRNTNSTTLTTQESCRYGEMMHQNGRLERDLEVRSLIDYCEENYLGHKDLFVILKSLKPLKP